MRESRVSIGQVKRDISDLVNRVAYSDERIILTSRGRAKAVIVSIEDYEQLRQKQVGDRLARWRDWVAQTETLTAEILARRGGVPIDVDELLRREREEREERDARLISGH